MVYPDQIMYKNRYLQINYLKSEPGAMSELVFVADTFSSSDSKLVLKRPVVSDRSKEIISLAEQDLSIRAEIQALKLISSISNSLKCSVLNLVDDGFDAGETFPNYHYHYFIMPFAKGQSLSSCKHQLPLIVIVNSFYNVLHTINTIHTNLNIVYNDARHEHIFWDSEIDPKGENSESITLIDFGNCYFGSPKYQQFNNQNLKIIPQFKDDFQSLGKSLYRLLTGRELIEHDQLNTIRLRPEYEEFKESIDRQSLINIVSALWNGEYDYSETALKKISKRLNEKYNSKYALLTGKFVVEQISENNFSIDEYIKKDWFLLGGITKKQYNLLDEEIEKLKKSNEYKHVLQCTETNVREMNWRTVIGKNIGQLRQYKNIVNDDCLELAHDISNSLKKMNELGFLIPEEYIDALLNIINCNVPDAIKSIRKKVLTLDLIDIDEIQCHLNFLRHIYIFENDSNRDKFKTISLIFSQLSAEKIVSIKIFIDFIKSYLEDTPDVALGAFIATNIVDIDSVDYEENILPLALIFTREEKLIYPSLLMNGEIYRKLQDSTTIEDMIQVFINLSSHVSNTYELDKIRSELQLIQDAEKVWDLFQIAHTQNFLYQLLDIDPFNPLIPIWLDSSKRYQNWIEDDTGWLSNIPYSAINNYFIEIYSKNYYSEGTIPVKLFELLQNFDKILENLSPNSRIDAKDWKNELVAQISCNIVGRAKKYFEYGPQFQPFDLDSVEAQFLEKFDVNGWYWIVKISNDLVNNNIDETIIDEKIHFYNSSLVSKNVRKYWAYLDVLINLIKDGGKSMEDVKEASIIAFDEIELHWLFDYVEKNQFLKIQSQKNDWKNIQKGITYFTTSGQSSTEDTNIRVINKNVEVKHDILKKFWYSKHRNQAILAGVITVFCMFLFFLIIYPNINNLTSNLSLTQNTETSEVVPSLSSTTIEEVEEKSCKDVVNSITLGNYQAVTPADAISLCPYDELKIALLKNSDILLQEKLVNNEFLYLFQEIIAKEQFSVDENLIGKKKCLDFLGAINSQKYLQIAGLIDEITFDKNSDCNWDPVDLLLENSIEIEDFGKPLVLQFDEQDGYLISPINEDQIPIIYYPKSLRTYSTEFEIILDKSNNTVSLDFGEILKTGPFTINVYKISPEKKLVRITWNYNAQELKIKMEIYTDKDYATIVVLPGDSLGGLAKKYGVLQENLIKYNDIIDPNSIQTGQTLILADPATLEENRLLTDKFAWEVEITNINQLSPKLLLPENWTDIEKPLQLLVGLNMDVLNLSN